MTENKSICARCGGRCCLYPVFEPHEVLPLRDIIGEEVYNAADPWPVGEHLIGFRKPCPGKGKTGCVLPYKNRPLVCRLFPFEPVPQRVENQDGKQEYDLLLAVGKCPHWKLFGMSYEKAMKELGGIREMIASHTVPKASGDLDMVPGQDFEKYINAHLFTIQEQLFWGTQWPNPEIETPDPKEFIRKCREGML